MPRTKGEKGLHYARRDRGLNGPQKVGKRGAIFGEWWEGLRTIFLERLRNSPSPEGRRKKRVQEYILTSKGQVPEQTKFKKRKVGNAMVPMNLQVCSET